jgi:glycosyltransferase involved in cell wall biosynthesis
MKPDIVHTWGNLESVVALILKPLHRYTLLNGSVRHGIRSVKMWHYIRTLMLHMSGNVLSNSYAGLRANKLKKGYVLYNGLDDQLIGRLNDVQKHEQRKRILGINNQTVLISVANLIPYKDYYSILRALKRIKEEGYSFIYIILGDGPLKEDIERKIAEYELLQHVRIPGHVTNVSDYLRISDIFIHSSKGEGCSNAILEAMAAGLPVIASRTGGTEEIVSTENGFLFEYKDSDQIYEYLVQCLHDTDKRQKMGEASYNIVMNKFTVATMIRNYENIISGLQ